jgi:hypothetical protein
MYAKYNAIVKIINENINASPTFNLPEAIGLFFFAGCRASLSLSMVSFIMYTLPDTNEKRGWSNFWWTVS